MERLWGKAALTLMISSVLAITCPPAAYAAFDLSWRPQMQLGTRATDNLRTTINNPEAAWGFDMGGGLQLELESSTLRSRITPAFNFRRFVIGEGADADEYEVRTSTQWTYSERVSAAIDLDYIRDSTLSTELTDAGRQTAVSNRDTINVAPSFNILFTERTSLNVGFFYSDVQFEQLPGTPFSDYEFKQVNGTLTHVLTERLSVFVNSYVSEFRTPRTNGKSLTYGGLTGANFRYSDTLEADFGVGYVQSEIDFQTTTTRLQLAVDPNSGQLIVVPVAVTTPQSTTESGPIARGSIRKIWSPLLDSELSYNRSVTPTVFGAQSVIEDILLSFERDITSRFRGLFRGGYNMRSAETDAIAGQQGNLNRNQVLLVAGVRYRITQEMSVGATYRFIYNDLEDLDASSYNNGLFVNFIYNGEPNSYYGF